MIGNGVALEAQKPKEALLYTIACCFPAFDGPGGIQRLNATNGVNADGNRNAMTQAKKLGLKLLASREDMFRAWSGGFGNAKLGASYGPSLIAQAEAKARGFDQILWLFGEQYDVTEAGASNVSFMRRTREGKLQLVTAPLDDKTILDGVTRRSVLSGAEIER